MVLILTITGSPELRPGETTRQVFTQEGGTIGRAGTSSWVLTHNKVSGRHAVISFRGGVFYIQDTSRNGVAINSRDNRLGRDRPYPLHPGDCIFIEPYEIDVAVESTSDRTPRRPALDPFGHDDPFGLIEDPVLGPQGLVAEAGESSAVDPVDLIEGSRPVAPPRPSRPAPIPQDDLMRSYVERPVVIPDPAPARSAPDIPPPGYNPLAEDPGSGVTRRQPPPEARLTPEPRPAREPRRSAEAAPAAEPMASGSSPPRPKPGNVSAKDLPPPSVAHAPAPEPVRPTPPAVTPQAPASAHPAASPVSAGPASDTASRELADLLAEAGVPDAAVTPELARNLGQILHVVVDGLMDVLRARHRIKQEFDIPATVFQAAENNPLKLSANVKDALDKLFVKRNAAYLGPVDAFTDAFADLRHHELAMLAGMRLAFDTLLAGFDPDALQKEFDRLIAKGGPRIVPAKLRYWELFRDKYREMAQDHEAAFVELFGEEFARAYEEQFRRLKAQTRNRPIDDQSIDTPGGDV